MAIENIVRPVWRSFVERYESEAAAWVRDGGCAVVWRESPAKTQPFAWLLLPLEADGTMTEQPFWAMLSLHRDSFAVVSEGACAGLATVRVLRDYEHEVERWCERDSKHREHVHTVTLDCMTCGACCKNNRVILEPEDLARFADGDREDLGRRPYVRRDGKLLLVALVDARGRAGDCVHLRESTCGIYTVRPQSCRDFPAGTEPCLLSRLEEFGIDD
ncbi:MAG: YkgJ family cysteine cluster protein [Deltaproteobacteria bacterium]|nr:YkgJ family cysteine cluster protein [Deltaproteobacteria bacterium]